MTKKVNIPNIGIAEVSEYIPDLETEKQILEFENQAEKDIALIQYFVHLLCRFYSFL